MTVVRSISKELAKRHEVVVYTTTALDPKHDSSPREEEVDGYRVVYFPRTFRQLCYTEVFGTLNLSLNMMKGLKENLKDFDIVHCHSWQQFPDVVVYHYATKYAVPYVLQTHGSIPRISKKFRKITYDVIFGYRVLNSASKVIALSQVEVGQYRRMGVPEEKIAIIPNGIDCAEYANLPPKGSFRKKFGIQDNQKIILYLGRIHKTKGIDLLIKAYAYLVNSLEFTTSLLVIAGPDDGYLREAECLVNSLGISGSVIFTGFISAEDKIRAFIDADVFVTTSFYGFPVTFLEACAIGVPIVTTTLGDTLEWIDTNVGYVISPTHPDIAKAINTILSNRELHRQFSANCRNIVQTKFSIEKIVNTLTQIYQTSVDSNKEENRKSPQYCWPEAIESDINWSSHQNPSSKRICACQRQH